MMDILRQQCFLAGLGYYKLKRKDGSLALDGIYGPATQTAIYNFQLAHKKRPDGTTLVVDGYWGPATEAALREVIAKNEEPQTPELGTDTTIVGYKWVSKEMFKCRCGGRYCNGWPAEPQKAELDLLERIGEHYQKPIRPHSGLRCKRWNADPQVGGAPTSKHLYGMAMDFHIDGVSPKELYDYCDSLLGNSGGLGLYSWGVHIDCRSVRGRW